MDSNDWKDIQGIVLRGYHYPWVRYFVLETREAGAARACLGGWGAPASGGLGVTSSEEWSGGKPAYCLNVGLTWQGMAALGLDRAPGFSFSSFPAFQQGAVARAKEVGDEGANAPSQWENGLGSGRDHAIVALFALEKTTLDEYTARLRQDFKRGGGYLEVSVIDAAALPGDRVHFGYRDGIAQPTVEGGPGSSLPDDQPESPAWNFVLVDDPGSTYYVPTPVELGRHGSFGAFRKLEQDVAGFEELLRRNPAGMDPELLAAKICGRWRNGIPLSLSPNTESPQPPISEEQLNDFDYVPTAQRPDTFNDAAGVRCPVGSHIRRTNPRSSMVMGGGNHLHRIIRRAMPYGPEYLPGQASDQVARGLVGFFVCASLENQFEFLMGRWINEGGFAKGLEEDAHDIIAGQNSPTKSVFSAPATDPSRTVRLNGFSSFVTTRGGAYCFFPSLTALRYIAAFQPPSDL